MSETSEAHLHPMRVYTTALKILLATGAFKAYPIQFDLTLDNLYSVALIERVEAVRELEKVKKSVNVKV